MERMNGSGQVAVVVGGGLAGLAAAAYLARDGYRVTVLERADAPGGRARTRERNGVLHNFGPHAFYRGGAAEEVLAELGVTFTGSSPNGMGVSIRNGRTCVLPRDTRTMLSSRLFRLRDRAEVAARMLTLRSADPESMRGRTVARYLREEFAHDSSRDYVEAVIRLATYANAPDDIDIADAMLQLRGGGIGGVTYIDGGWQTLVDGLRTVAERAGAAVHAGARAARVEPGHRPAVVLGDGRRIEAQAVILAVAPTVAAELLQVAATRRWADDAVAARAACLDVTLRGLPRPRRLFGLGVDKPWYLSVHTRFARLAPEGLTTVSVAKYLRAGAPHDAEADLRELEGMLDLVQPGWREAETGRQFLPEMVVTTAVPRSDRGGIPGRPGPAVPGAEGVLVAGDWVGPTGWLANATLGSARMAAREAARQLAAPKARELALPAIG
jgi:phytoene dehydrogenase-like protein